MSNPLSDAREALRDLLATSVGGLQVFTVLPERVTPPFAYVAPSEPYLDFTGANFGGVLARFQVGAVVKSGTNDKRAAEVDELALQVMAALDDNEHGFVVESVDRPGFITLPSGQAHLAAPINVWVEIRL